jgi:hypothetical protein
VDDGRGNSAVCTQMVIVVDGQAPTIRCPGSVVVYLAEGMTGAGNVALGDPMVTDNCGVAGVTNNGSICYPVGTNLVVWTATGVDGLQSTCTQQVIVARIGSSNFGVVGVKAIGNDIQLTWQTVGTTTNLIQLVTPITKGDYTNSYINLDAVVVPGSGPVITNWVDHGGATNRPSRYYRIGLQTGQPCTP